VKIFLTGATGFLGGTLARRLVVEGHAVRGMLRPDERADERSAALRALGVEPVVGSLDQADLLARESRAADAVVNAADSDHAGAVHAIVEGLRGSAKPLLHTSGTSIVGDASNGQPSPDIFDEQIMDRDSAWTPAPDKAARVAIDRAVLDAAQLGPRTVVLCNSMIYGTGTGLNPDSVQIPRLVRQARTSGVVRHVGPGANTWSNVHLDDVCELYLRALRAARPGSFYFVENGEESFAAIAAAIAAALRLGPPEPWPVEDAIAEWGYEPAVYALGSNSRVRGTRARAELGWAPRHRSVTDWIRLAVARAYTTSD
jgi:nucleoside-diphosphate-sugar epimerase